MQRLVAHKIEPCFFLITVIYDADKMAWALKGVEALNLFRKRPKGFIFCDTEPTWTFKEVESSHLQW